MNSRRTAGLSSSGVTEEADLIFRWEMLTEVDEVIGLGPGLSSMSPVSRRRRRKFKGELMVR